MIVQLYVPIRVVFLAGSAENVYFEFPALKDTLYCKDWFAQLIRRES